MELFWLEHKKLWRKSSVKISVLLCFTYIVIVGYILSFQWFSFGSRGDYTSAFGNNFDGYSVIRDSQEHSLLFGGELTDETLQQLVKDYQTMISYVEPKNLTGFYERRQQAIEEFLEINNQVGEEREYLLQMNEKVRIPLQYEWVEGWSVLLGSMIAELGTVMALFLAIALSPLFAGERHDHTSTLILTTKNGWEKIAYAKICSGLAFTVEFFVLIAGSSIVAQLCFMGTSGWDMPIQTIKLIAISPMNMLQAEIYEYVFVLLGSIGFAGIVMLISATVKSNVLALLLSFTVVYGPMMIVGYLPYTLQKALDLLPLVGSSADIFRTNTFNILGKIIWSPYLLITVPVLIGIVCVPFAVKSWSKMMKA